MKKRFFYKNKNLLYCTFWYMLVLFGYMALDHCTVINSVRPFLFVHKELHIQQHFSICFLTWIHFEYCVSYSFGHLQIRFLDQKNPLLRFLNFPKFEYCFLYSVSYIPILSVCNSIQIDDYKQSTNLYIFEPWTKKLLYFGRLKAENR